MIDTADTNKASPKSLSPIAQGKRKAANVNKKTAKKRIVEDPANETSEMTIGVSFQ